MKTLDDSVAETERTERGIALSHGSVIDRMLASACSVIVLPAFGVLMCSYILACCRGELRGDAIYGDYFPFTPLFMVLCFPTVLGLSWFLANFRIARPKRFVREAIAWLLLLYVAFGLHCLAAYLFFGDGMVFAAAVRGFCGRAVDFSFIIVAAFVLLPGLCLEVLFVKLLQKRIGAKMVKRGKPMKTTGLSGKLNGFIDNYPALVVTGTKEYVYGFARYAIWGALLSLLSLEVMIAFCFAMKTQSLSEMTDPAYEASVEQGEGQK